nr:hypothetical protein [Tanacetum cinerariifolium]
VAGDHLQHVVEVVGDAAGQAADGFQLLRLAQLFFGGRACLHFVVHALLEVAGELAQGLLGDLALAFGE